MSGVRLTLFRRHLARLRANRTVAIGLALGMLCLALLSTTLFLPVQGDTLSSAEAAFRANQRFWQGGNPFGLLTFVLAIVLGSSMLNDDIKAGTIFGVLARPVSRTDYFLGSWSAAAAFLLTVEALRCATSVGVALTLEGRIPIVAFVAMFAVLAGDVLRLAMFAAFGAICSTGVAVFAGIAVFIVEGVAFVPSFPSWISYPLRAIAVFLPLVNGQEGAIAACLTGASREVAPLIEIIAYRLCWTTALLLLGIWAFQRREVAPRI